MTDSQPLIHLGPLPPGRHGLPREVVVGSQRERILRGMAGAVAERGYARTRVSDVLERAGVSRRTFYEQFSNKADCFVAAYDDAVTRAMEDVQAGYAEPGTWKERLTRGFGAFLRFLSAQPDYARMCIVDVSAAGPEALERRDAALAGFAWLIAESHRDAPDAHVLPAMYFDVIVGGIYHVIYQRVFRGQTEELPDLLDDLVYCAMAAGGPSAER
ncbi:MAG TPA: TetR/AcrR family transcriptional regulator [Thermoleophilaceae bacterium]|jgi:AcrR family transcriptional regulator